LQNRHDKKEHDDIHKSLLETLSENLHDIYNRLNKIKQNSNTYDFDQNFYQHFGFEYFDIDISKAVIIKLMDVKLFPENKDIFKRIIKLFDMLQLLNGQIKNYGNLLLSGVTDASPNNSLQSDRFEIFTKIDSITAFIKDNYSQNNSSLMEEIENIKID
jgi:hypothetical protein